MLGLTPYSLFTPHVGQTSGTGASGRILALIVGAARNPEGKRRLFRGWEDDFHGFLNAGMAISGTVTGTLDRYSRYVDTATATGNIASTNDYGGVLALTTPAQNNHETWLKGGVCGRLDRHPLQFEVRVTLPATGRAFVGLTAPGAVAADFLTDAGALIDANHLGFLVVDGNITLVARKSGEATVTLGTIGTVSGTQKLGFAYGSRSGDGQLKVFLDGVEVLSFNAADIDEDEVPMDVALAPIVGLKNNSAAARTLAIDWGYCFHQMQ